MTLPLYASQVCLQFVFLNALLAFLYCLIATALSVSYYFKSVNRLIIDLFIVLSSVYLFIMGFIRLNPYMMAASTCFLIAYYIYMENVQICDINPEILLNSLMCSFVIHAVSSLLTNVS